MESTEAISKVKTGKIIGARYYEGDTALDKKGHGIHTASTAAGRVVENANLFGIANGTAQGGVPLARIATYKVCGFRCDEKDVMAAFDDAIADNVDVISISIGSQYTVNISDDVIAIGSFHAMQKGILTIQAAGNIEFPILKTTVSIAPWLFTVAASGIDRKIINKLVLGNTPTLLIEAKIANASGLILRKYKTVFNDVAIDAILPMAILHDSEFEFVESYLKSNKFPSARILKSEAVHSPTPGPIVASFSARGPNAIIPEIFKHLFLILLDFLTYPVQNINSNLELSMACPHVTGAVAYVKSKHLDWSTTAIKSSIMTTAWTMNMEYNVDAELGYGAGLIDPVKAAYPGLVYETSIHEYINMFCSVGSEGDKLRKMLGVETKCPEGIKTSPKDLNYPAMTAPIQINSSFNIQFSRVVTNVGDKRWTG
ncbi:subtilisin-like protease SBT4.3 [Impatiens glandulifera]|uniref:subtilisin-like protease SBT4.3 n=1 Tax=Impatiens glandulifera TaxID=253017 RepID=UPI001FB168E6|nr:subtilisin-like protease SBT4.3 [Impatiens glandulifera]